MATNPEVVGIEYLVRHQSAQVAALVDRLSVAMAGAWQTYWGLDDTRLDQYVGAVVPLVQGAQLHMSAITAAYLAAAVSDMSGAPAVFAGTPAGLVIGPRIRLGTPPEEVYRRPIVTARALVAEGVPIDEASRRGLERSQSLAATDLQSSQLYTAQHILSGDRRVQGYRRSLTGRENCGLCVVASTRRYHKADLMPRHPGCDCVPVPIVGGQDPGEVINRPLLESLHQSVIDRFGPDAKDLDANSPAYHRLVTVYDHGELGPVLARTGDHHLTSASADARP